MRAGISAADGKLTSAKSEKEKTDFMTQTVPPRREIPIEYTWDAYSIYPSDTAWEAAFRELDESLAGLEKFHGKLHESPALLADYLGIAETSLNTLYKLYVYASMFHEVDTADQEAAAKDSRTTGLLARVMAALAFAEPEILAIPGDTLQQWRQQEPRLAHYGHYFDQLERRRAHVRSAEVEELLGQVSEPFHTATNMHSVLADAD
jgi:oligoendopeptidase F